MFGTTSFAISARPERLALISLAIGSLANTATAQSSAGPQHVVVDPSVLSPPPASVLADHYPKEALSKDLEGTALLECDVTKEGALVNCTSPAELPVGAGFGAAAIGFAPLYKMRPKTIDGVPVDGGHIILTLHFALPPSPVGTTAETPLDHPWLACPDNTVPTQSYYPKKAQRLNKAGSAAIQCQVSAVGRAEACVWISESDPGLGFGDAAEKLGCLFKFKPKMVDGVPMEGLFKTTVRFDLPK